jgi:hypothetical protein
MRTAERTALAPVLLGDLVSMGKVLAAVIAGVRGSLVRAADVAAMAAGRCRE